MFILFKISTARLAAAFLARFFVFATAETCTRLSTTLIVQRNFLPESPVLKCN